MKKNSLFLSIKILCLAALITTTAAIGTKSSQACEACMVVWSGGTYVASCVACGHLGWTGCQPEGDHCSTSSYQCDPNPENQSRPECPPIN